MGATWWRDRNQFGRRNLAAYVRTQLALRLEETIAARAKAKERDRKSSTCQKSDKSLPTIDTKKEIADIAGVSHDTVAKVKKIAAAEKAGKVDAETGRQASVGATFSTFSTVLHRGVEKLWRLFFRGFRAFSPLLHLLYRAYAREFRKLPRGKWWRSGERA